MKLHLPCYNNDTRTGAFDLKQLCEMHNDLDIYMEHLQTKTVHRGNLSNVGA